jgi:hypothetical protein
MRRSLLRHDLQFGDSPNCEGLIMFLWRIRSCSPTMLAAAVLTLALPGCFENRKPVFPVRGKVLFRGQPAEGALVVFNPLDESDPQAVKPQGMVGSDGSFEMSTYGEKDGAPAGEYIVSFVWMIENPKTKKIWSPLPARFMQPDKSGWRLTIKDGPNELQPFLLAP